MEAPEAVHELSPESRWAIVVLHERLHWSIYDIAGKIPCAENTVRHWLKRYRHLGNVDDLPRSGRPRATSSDDDRFIYEAAHDEKLNAPEIAIALEKDRGHTPSLSTIRKRLRESDLFYGSARKKPPLTDAMKKARLAFAEKYTDFDWYSVIFLDYFTVDVGRGHVKFWRHEGEWAEYHAPPHPAKRHVLLAVYNAGVVGYHVFSENLTAARHISFFDDHIFPSMVDKRIKSHKLLTDNARNINARVVQDAYKAKKIKRLTIPAYSPDINLVENLIHVVKYRVRKERPETVDQLERALQKVIERVTARDTLPLFDSMPNRMQMLKEAEGGSTPY